MGILDVSLGRLTDEGKEKSIETMGAIEILDIATYAHTAAVA